MRQNQQSLDLQVENKDYRQHLQYVYRMYRYFLNESATTVLLFRFRTVCSTVFLPRAIDGNLVAQAATYWNYN